MMGQEKDDKKFTADLDGDGIEMLLGLSVHARQVLDAGVPPFAVIGALMGTVQGFWKLKSTSPTGRSCAT